MPHRTSAECRGLPGRCNLFWAACLMLSIVLLITHSLVGLQRGEGPTQTAGLEETQVNDLHGLHDLLLVGYAGVFVRDLAPGRVAATAVQAAALELVELLPALHPVPGCRVAIAEATARVAGQPLMQVTAAASAAWSCLPARFSAKDFSATFTADAIKHRTLQAAAKNPRLLPGARAQLGACKESSWDRTCSYWSVLHVLAARAEMSGIGSRFLIAYITAIAGGATMCKG